MEYSTIFPVVYITYKYFLTNIAIIMIESRGRLRMSVGNAYKLFNRRIK